MTTSVNWSNSSPDRRMNMYRSGSNSPRSGNKLLLRENPFKFYKTDAQRPFIVEQRTCAPDFRKRSYVKNGYTDATYMTLQTVPSSGLYNLADVLNEHRIKLRNEIRSQDINLAVAYAEKTETANLLFGTAKKLISAASALKRGRLNETARHLGLPRPPKRRRRKDRGTSTGKSLADKWLEYSYGWVPLYNDMYGAMVAFDKAVNLVPDRSLKVEASSSFEKEILFPLNLRLFDNLHQIVVKRKIRQRVKLVAHYSITNPNLHTVDSLGLTNPALVAWELVPFSFVVDWACPIGDWLQSVAPLAGVNFGQVYKTIVSEEVTEIPFSEKTNTVYFQDTPVGAPLYPTTTCRMVTASFVPQSKKKFFYVERSADTLTGPPAPPSLKIPSAWQQAASAVALLTNLLDSFRSRR